LFLEEALSPSTPKMSRNEMWRRFSGPLPAPADVLAFTNAEDSAVSQAFDSAEAVCTAVLTAVEVEV
jgi:hypothetical protein